MNETDDLTPEAYNVCKRRNGVCFLFIEIYCMRKAKALISIFFSSKYKNFCYCKITNVRYIHKHDAKELFLYFVIVVVS